MKIERMTEIETTDIQKGQKNERYNQQTTGD